MVAIIPSFPFLLKMDYFLLLLKWQHPWPRLKSIPLTALFLWSVGLVKLIQDFTFSMSCLTCDATSTCSSLDTNTWGVVATHALSGKRERFTERNTLHHYVTASQTHRALHRALAMKIGPYKRAFRCVNRVNATEAHGLHGRTPISKGLFRPESPFAKPLPQHDNPIKYLNFGEPITFNILWDSRQECPKVDLGFFSAISVPTLSFMTSKPST
jgi:hypothetical protein